MPSRPKKSRPEQRKQRFIEAIERGLNVVKAAEYAGWSDRTTPYKAAETDPAFANAWELARQRRLVQLEDSMMDLALTGNVRLMIYLHQRFNRQVEQDNQDDQQRVTAIEIIMPGDTTDAANHHGPQPFISIED